MSAGPPKPQLRRTVRGVSASVAIDPPCPLLLIKAVPGYVLGLHGVSRLLDRPSERVRRAGTPPGPAVSDNRPPRRRGGRSAGGPAMDGGVRRERAGAACGGPTGAPAAIPGDGRRRGSGIPGGNGGRGSGRAGRGRRG